MTVLRRHGREAFLLLVGLTFVAGSLWLGYQRWLDCRSEHSWLYCAAFQD